MAAMYFYVEEDFYNNPIVYGKYRTRLGVILRILFSRGNPARVRVTAPAEVCMKIVDDMTQLVNATEKAVKLSAQKKVDLKEQAKSSTDK